MIGPVLLSAVLSGIPFADHPKREAIASHADKNSEQKENQPVVHVLSAVSLGQPTGPINHYLDWTAAPWTQRGFVGAEAIAVLSQSHRVMLPEIGSGIEVDPSRAEDAGEIAVGSVAERHNGVIPALADVVAERFRVFQRHGLSAVMSWQMVGSFGAESAFIVSNHAASAADESTTPDYVLRSGAVALSAFTVAEIEVTRAVLERGGREQNPLFRKISDSPGVLGLVNGAMTAGLGLVAAELDQRGKKTAARIWLWTMVAVKGFVLAHNWRELDKTKRE